MTIVSLLAFILPLAAGHHLFTLPQTNWPPLVWCCCNMTSSSSFGRVTMASTSYAATSSQAESFARSWRPLCTKGESVSCTPAAPSRVGAPTLKKKSRNTIMIFILLQFKRQLHSEISNYITFITITAKHSIIVSYSVSVIKYISVSFSSNFTSITCL